MGQGGVEEGLHVFVGGVAIAAVVEEGHAEGVPSLTARILRQMRLLTLVRLLRKCVHKDLDIVPQVLRPRHLPSALRVEEDVENAII